MGSSDAATIISNINWKGFDSPEAATLKEWLEDWLQQSDETTRQKFLRAVTAAPALPPGSALNIQRMDNEGQYPAAHTCSWTLDLPQYPDKKTFKERMGELLAAVDQGFGTV